MLLLGSRDNPEIPATSICGVQKESKDVRSMYGVIVIYRLFPVVLCNLLQVYLQRTVYSRISTADGYDTAEHR